MEDDLVHEGADVLSADAAHPYAPVKRERAPQRRPTRLARVAHFQPHTYAHLQKYKIILQPDQNLDKSHIYGKSFSFSFANTDYYTS